MEMACIALNGWDVEASKPVMPASVGFWKYLAAAPPCGRSGCSIPPRPAAVLSRGGRKLCFGTALFVALAALPVAASDHEEKAQDFFESTNLLTFKVELDNAEFNQLAQRPRTYVPGRVRVGERVWENV